MFKFGMHSPAALTQLNIDRCSLSSGITMCTFSTHRLANTTAPLLLPTCAPLSAQFHIWSGEQLYKRYVVQRFSYSDFTFSKHRPLAHLVSNPCATRNEKVGLHLRNQFFRFWMESLNFEWSPQPPIAIASKTKVANGSHAKDELHQLFFLFCTQHSLLPLLPWSYVSG